MKSSTTISIGIKLLAPAMLVAAVGGVVSAQQAAPGTQRHEEIVRSWQDRVKIDGRDQLRRVEIVFDYELGVARRRTYTAQDWLISDEVLAAQPRASTAEIAEAFDAVHRDPELGQLARSVNAIIDGGFLLHEAAGKPCAAPPARCVQVYMLSESGHEEHRRPIVDLTPRGQIVYRDYSPSAAD